jgi:hypothetical protein
MFERLSQAAEKLAASVSRRQFLGALGRGAFAAVGIISGLLAVPGEATASPRCPHGMKLKTCTNGQKICCPPGAVCVLFYGAPMCRAFSGIE